MENGYVRASPAAATIAASTTTELPRPTVPAGGRFRAATFALLLSSSPYSSAARTGLPVKKLLAAPLMTAEPAARRFWRSLS